MQETQDVEEDQPTKTHLEFVSNHENGYPILNLADQHGLLSETMFKQFKNVPLPKQQETTNKPAPKK